jgi:hypothetical protein
VEWWEMLNARVDANLGMHASRIWRFAVRVLLILVFLYGSWLAMMAVHEFGHVLHAWISGGRVARVYFCPWDFSRTDLSTNPHPQFVAWGGAVWGSILPLGVYLLVRKLWPAVSKGFLFFAGFCLVINGVYLGIGWTVRGGDGATLLHYGA